MTKKSVTISEKRLMSAADSPLDPSTPLVESVRTKTADALRGSRIPICIRCGFCPQGPIPAECPVCGAKAGQFQTLV